MRTRSVGKSWRKLLGSQQAPAGLTLVTECPPLSQGGTEAIAQWLDRNPDTRMVVIDVFAKMRGQAPQGVSAYNEDDVPVGYAKRLADHDGIAVVLVHHVRKAGSDGFLTEVSGTNGIAGAADATLVLKRARGRAGRRTASCTSPAATSTKPNTPSASNPPPAPGTYWTAP
ncbi:AAA family ATPase [Streptomyces mirabilis]|uniref:AAA family ATPase n=1 Tax=Streptomyces mirabilis TaxID=68239 RepID=UPI0036A53D60